MRLPPARRARRSRLLARLVVFLTLTCVVAGCGGGGAGGALGDPAPPAPLATLTALEPFEGDVTGGNEISVLGESFLAATPPLYLRFGSRIVPVVAFEDGRIRVEVPPGDAVGPVEVALHGPDALSVLPGGYRYRPAPPPPPAVGFLPAVGQAGTRVDVILTGFPYLDAPEVRFGGVLATSVQVLGTGVLRVVRTCGGAARPGRGSRGGTRRLEGLAGGVPIAGRA